MELYSTPEEEGSLFRGGRKKKKASFLGQEMDSKRKAPTVLRSAALVIFLFVTGQMLVADNLNLQSFMSKAPIERRKENHSTIVDDDDNFESVAETSTIENTRLTTRKEEYRSLPTNVLDEIQAYLSIDVTQRPLPPNTPGAFLHVGKAGGSTLCSVHPLSFHSFVLKSRYNQTRRIEKGLATENYFGATTTYVHTPDFHMLGGKYYPKYSFYVANLRDPYTKFLSFFSVSHNCRTNFKCFPTLESFATMVGDDPTNFDYPHGPREDGTDNCTSLARATMASKVLLCADHAYWNTKTILEHIPGWYTNDTSKERRHRRRTLTTSVNSPFHNQSTITTTSISNTSSGNSSPPFFFLAIRTEHMNEDFFMVNQLLGDPHPVLLKDAGVEYGRVQAKYKVSKNVTDIGRTRLCKALLPEYKVYFEALSRAVNLSPRDRQNSLELSRTHCPELDWLFRKDFVTS